MNHTTQRLHKLETCLIPEIATAYLLTEDIAQKSHYAVKLAELHLEYQERQAQLDHMCQGTGLNLCATPDTYNQQNGIVEDRHGVRDYPTDQHLDNTKLCADVSADTKSQQMTNKSLQDELKFSLCGDKTADTYSQQTSLKSVLVKGKLGDQLSRQEAEVSSLRHTKDKTADTHSQQDKTSASNNHADAKVHEASRGNRHKTADIFYDILRTESQEAIA